MLQRCRVSRSVTSLTAAAACCVLPAISLSAVARPQTVAPARGASAGQNIWDGIYTNAQAARGRAVFLERCAFCHGEDLNGGDGPALVGASFGRGWGSRYLDRLFKKVQERMPPGEADLVPDKDKLDIITFLLQSNGFPAGKEELPLNPAVLAGIQIVGKDGPQPPPTGAMVEVVGCLAEDGGAWKLTSSTEPVITTMDDPAQDAIAAASHPLGADTVRLLDVFPRPDEHKGHRMIAKGLLIRTGADIQVNVLALEMVAPSCP